MMPDTTEQAGMEAVRTTRVWRDVGRKGWEWAAVGELMAMVVVAMMVLGACMGMVMQFVNPHRRAKKLVQVVQQAVDTPAQLQS